MVLGFFFYTKKPGILFFTQLHKNQLGVGILNFYSCTRINQELVSSTFQIVAQQYHTSWHPRLSQLHQNHLGVGSLNFLNSPTTISHELASTTILVAQEPIGSWHPQPFLIVARQCHMSWHLQLLQLHKNHSVVGILMCSHAYDFLGLQMHLTIVALLIWKIIIC